MDAEEIFKSVHYPAGDFFYGVADAFHAVHQPVPDPPYDVFSYLQPVRFYDFLGYGFRYFHGGIKQFGYRANQAIRQFHHNLWASG